MQGLGFGGISTDTDPAQAFEKRRIRIQPGQSIIVVKF